MTPFAQRLNQLSQQQTIKMPSIEVKQDTSMLGNFRTNEYSPEELDYNSKRSEVESKYNSHETQVAQLADQLRTQVNNGQISMLDAEHQLNKFVDSAVESEYQGFNEFNTRAKAATYSAQHPDVSGAEALNMYQQGIDPDQINRDESLANMHGIMMQSQQGVM